jgi:subtilisin family serine protease
LQEAIDLANSRGAAVVVAAGNESQSAVNSSPANCRGVISVAAGTRTGALAPYSNYGSAVDLTAPGGDMTASVEDGILSTANGGAEAPNGEEIHFFAQGTSAAAPHVAGVAALLLAKMGPAATPADVEARLKATARPMPGGCLLGCGAGLVDAAAAVQPDRVRMTMVIAPGDLNSDRKPDLLARDSNGTLWLYPGNGRGGWLSRVQVGPGWNVMTAVVGSGDMNGDGKADVLARDTFGALWLYPGNGRGGLLSRVPAGNGWNVMTAMTGPGDFNGDGKSDLLARDTAGRLWLYPGNGRGGWLSRVQAGNGWNYMTAIIGHGDFNGDLRNDLLAVDTSGLLWLYRGNGAGAWLGSAQVGSGWN